MTSPAQAWISAAPAGWVRGRLGTMVASAINGTWGSDPSDGDEEGVVLCVRAADFDRNGHRVNPENLPRRNIELSVYRQHRLRIGDLILEKSGGGERQPVGAAVLFDLAMSAVCSNFCARIVPTIGIDSRFLCYVFAAAYGQGLTQSAIKQTTGIQNLDSASFFASPWAYPGVDEQRQIADFLDREASLASAFIDSRRRMLGLLAEREAASLDASLEEHRIRFGTVPFRRLITAVSQGASPQCEAYPAGDNEWGVLKVSCLRPGEFFPGENKRLPTETEPNTQHEVREGDLLITRANTPALVGSAAVVPRVRERLLLSDKIFRVRMASDIEPRYIEAVAKGSRVRSLCSVTSNGASQSMANIRFEEIKNWPIPQASPSTQRQLVARTANSQRATHEARRAIEKQLELLIERKQALITAAVTGQIDVSTARGVEVS